MTLETVLIPTFLDGDYGIHIDIALHVTFELTPADAAPRDAYGRPEYPDSPEQIEIRNINMHSQAGWVALATFDHQSIELAVQEELATQRERSAEMAGESA